MGVSPLAGVLRYVHSLVGVPQPSTWGDGALLRRFHAQHDQTALVTLLQRHGPLVLGVCRQILPDPAAAEDAFQATFLVLTQKADELECQDSLAPWLHRVAYRIALKARTASARRQTHEQESAAMKSTEPDEHSPQDWQPLLHEEIDRLPEKYRLSVVRCYLQEQTHETAAQELGWPVGTVKGRLSRARDLLRQRLARRGLAFSAAAFSTALTQSATTAAVPAALQQATLQVTATALANGVVAAPVLALAQGALATMTGLKLQRVLLALLLGGLLVAGGTYAGYRVIHRSLASADAMASENGTPPAARPDPAADALTALRAKLAQPIDLDKGIDANTPLRDTLEFLADRYAFKFSIDEKAFLEAGVPNAGEQPVSLPKMKGVRISVVLRLLLGQIKGGDSVARFRLQGDTVEFTPVMESALERGARLAPDHAERAAPERSLAAQLDATINLENGIEANTPLKDALEHLAEAGGLTVLIDTQSFEDLGIKRIEDELVQLAPTKSIKLVAALDQLLRCIKSADRVPISIRLCRLLGNDQPAFCLQAMTGCAPRPVLTADGRLLALPAGGGRALRLWDMGTGRVRHELKTEEELASLAFAPDGQTLTTVTLQASDEPAKQCSVSHWDVASGTQTPKWERPAVRCVALSPDGGALAALEGGNLMLRDGATGKELCRGEPVQGAISELSFSADGRLLLALLSDPTVPTVCLWETSGRRRLVRLTLDAKAGGNGLPIHSARLSGDGKLLATIDLLNQVSLWEVASGQRLTHFRIGEVVSVAFAPDGKLLAAVTSTGKQGLWEVGTGRQVARLRATSEELGEVLFGADGKTLVASREGSTAVIWDVADLRVARPSATPLAARELESLWNDLASDNALRGRQALLQLAAAPEQAVPFLQTRLRPVTAQDLQRIAALIADLDHARFAVRQQASEDIVQLGKLAEPALRRVLNDKPPVEVQRRAEAILLRLEGPVTSPEQLRVLRGIEALEQADTGTARQLLDTLAKGEADGLTTQEAKAALQRLANRRKSAR